MGKFSKSKEIEITCKTLLRKIVDYGIVGHEAVDDMGK